MFISKPDPPKLVDKNVVFIFKGYDLLIKKNPEGFPLPSISASLNSHFIRQHYLGMLNATHCFCAEVNDIQFPADMYFQHLKKTYDRLGDALFGIACKAVQILHWDKIHQFCSACTTKLELKQTERAKVCPKCELHFFPKFSAAILVAVERGDEILLARSPHFPPGNYSVLAGFIEPGETAEEAVTRETEEEVGVRITNIHYFASQSWPFPDSFMLGFTADYLSGEISIDPREIEDAQWFHINHLPPLPSTASISRRLIENFIAKKSNH